MIITSGGCGSSNTRADVNSHGDDVSKTYTIRAETTNTQKKQNIQDNGIQPVQFDDCIISDDGLELDVR